MENWHERKKKSYAAKCKHSFHLFPTHVHETSNLRAVASQPIKHFQC